MGERPRARTPLAVALTAAAALAAPATGAAAPSVQITTAGPAVTGLSGAEEVAAHLVGPGVALSGPASINGAVSPAAYAAALPSFGRFTGGMADVGMADGLVVTANARAGSFAGGSTDPALATDRDDNELFDVASAAGLCTRSIPADCINNATSIEFAVVPTKRYLKFEYALAITEVGTHDGSAWSGNVIDFPDGFALFVGGRQAADNCAVVPRTGAYLTMQSAGIVPPAVTGNGRAAALANLAARVDDPAAPAGFAYAAQTAGWNVQFLTVPLTCVADVGAELAAGAPVGVKVVVADANDGAIPPAVFLKGGSVRFSGDDTPSDAVDPVPAAPPAADPGPGPVSPAPSPSPAPAPGRDTPAGPRTTPAVPIGRAIGRRPARGRPVEVVHRLRLGAPGRYTLIYSDRRTGRRLVLQPGSAVGGRTLPRRATAPMVRTARPGVTLVLRPRFAARAFPARTRDLRLRVVHLSRDGVVSRSTIAVGGRPR